jgi:hypothetical protein
MTMCNLRETLIGVLVGLVAACSSLELCKIVLSIVVLGLIPAQILIATNMKHLFVTQQSYNSLVVFQIVLGIYFALSLYLNW